MGQHSKLAISGCVRTCMRARVRACVRACASVRVRAWPDWLEHLSTQTSSSATGIGAHGTTRFAEHGSVSAATEHGQMQPGSADPLDLHHVVGVLTRYNTSIDAEHLTAEHCRHFYTYLHTQRASPGLKRTSACHETKQKRRCMTHQLLPALTPGHAKPPV